MIHSYALTTVAKLRIFLRGAGDGEGELLELLINMTTDFIETYCDRRFASTVYTDEEYDGTGMRDLLLNNYPIISVTRLQLNNAADNSDDWEDVDVEDYFKYDSFANFKLAASRFLKAPQRYRVTYTAGYATIPSDLEWACLKLCANAYRSGLAEGVKSEKLGDHTIVWFDDFLRNNTILGNILNLHKRHYIA